MVQGKIWHNLGTAEVLRELETNRETGLSNGEVLKRKRKFGQNKPPEERPLSGLGVFLNQLQSPLIYVLLIAGIVTVFLKEFTDAIVIFSAVFLNTAVGYLQESKASKALRELRKIVKVRTKVFRDSRELEVDSEDLAPGDIIILTPGNKVPADARLIEVYNLKINEASLTGEWLAAEKNTEPLSKDASLADRDNMVFMGTITEEGTGRAVVVSIGTNTEIGKIAEFLGEGREESTPLQKKLAKLSRTIGGLIILTVFLIFIGGVLEGREFIEMFVTSVAVAVAAIPEGLPVAMTVILALGMQRILKRQGLVRRLVSAETLGSTSIALTDKTLTLTQGKMTLAEAIGQDKNRIFTIAALCSDAFIENPEDDYLLWRVRGEVTDKALVFSAAENGIKKPDLEKEYFEVDDLPFSHANRFAVRIFRFNNSYVLFISGAPEKIIEFSKISPDKKDLSEKELDRLTGNGFRVIAFAFKDLGKDLPRYKKIEELFLDLEFAGLLAFEDPLREEAREAIELCKMAGIRPILVTGDHLLTAKSVARAIGLRVGDNNVIEGRNLVQISDEDLEGRLKYIDVYARVEPRDKLRIVEAFQKKGEVVAMTGDGVNDAPALKQADIGVALGSGTDIAKEVSDLILLTDNFSIIPAAIEEGRWILDNVRNVITYLLSDSFTETILIGASIIFGLPLPVSAVQILWVNLIEDGLPSLALAFEPKEKDLMKRPLARKDSSLLTKEMKVLIFLIGIFSDLVLLGVFLWLSVKNYDIQYIRTVIFVVLGINSLLYIFSCKSLRNSIWRINLFSNVFLNISVIVGFVALFSAVYFPPFQALLKTVPLALNELILVFGLGFADLMLIELGKFYFIANHKTER
ncbi:MAG: HAD-IC family P-type ATPase [Candidatus Nealsonbacteria bacterium]|nr:HAD-IC family P-type ATPase [Candidatus Nealsonbacteria bacterium]